MPGRHSLRARRAERGMPRRAVELVDAHTFTANLLTDAAVAAGQLARVATLPSAVKRCCLSISLNLHVATACSTSIPTQRPRS